MVAKASTSTLGRQSLSRSLAANVLSGTVRIESDVNT